MVGVRTLPSHKLRRLSQKGAVNVGFMSLPSHLQASISGISRGRGELVRDVDSWQASDCEFVMTRHEDLRSDEAFCKAVQATRGIASIMYGTEMSKEEAEMLVSIALTTFANAGGLNEASLSRLARFTPAGDQRATDTQPPAQLN
jgi:hypothetical protein